MYTLENNTQPKNGGEATETNNQATIPYSHLIFNQNKKIENIMSHCRVVFDSMVFLNGFNEQLKLLVEKSLEERKIKLKESNEGNKLRKTLFVDLDETLVRGAKESSAFIHECLIVNGNAMWFFVRPYAYEFLREMSEIF